MVLIQLLLPTIGVARIHGMAPLAETRRELADRFNGLTAYLRSPAKGWWTAPDGHTEEDDVVMVEIVTETFDRAWWRAYAATPAARYEDVVSGWQNKLQSAIANVTPAWILAEQHRRMAEPGSAKKANA